MKAFVTNRAVFDPKELVIDLYDAAGMHVYEIDLADCADSAQILDWIFQIHGKVWADAELVENLLSAFEQASREVFSSVVQGVICPNGISNTVDWGNAKVSRPVKESR